MSSSVEFAAGLGLATLCKAAFVQLSLLAPLPPGPWSPCPAQPLPAPAPHQRPLPLLSIAWKLFAIFF